MGGTEATATRTARIIARTVWVLDSTPIECARSRDVVRGSDLAGWAKYGCCASHSRYFWGLRLHLVATLHGLPVVFAITGAKTDERRTLLDLADAGLRLLRPARNSEPERDGQRLFKPLRQSSNDLRHRQGPPRPRTPRRPHPDRSPDPRPAPAAGPDRSDLA